MGRVAELARWTCDACGIEGDGVGLYLPEEWGSLSRIDDSWTLAFCPKCILVLTGMIEVRDEMFASIRNTAEGLMIMKGSPISFRSPVVKLMTMLCGGQEPPSVVRCGVLNVPGE